MNADIVRRELMELISQIKREPFDEGHDGLYDALLTGEGFKMSWQDMVYLFLETQKKYGIRFEAEHLADDTFNTINRIAGHIIRLRTAQYET